MPTFGNHSSLGNVVLAAGRGFIILSRDRSMESHAGARVAPGNSWVMCLALAGGLAMAGCNSADAPPAEPKTANDVLERMVSAYHQANSYADSGEGRLKFALNGEKLEDAFNFSVTFARPNKLRMHFYRANLVCDGKDLRATIEDLPNQILSVTAPPVLNTADVYGNDMLRNALTEGPASGSVQLALLLDEKPLVPVLEGATEVTLLSPEKIDDADCHRVRIQRKDGTLVFWIDRASYALRRIEYPIDEMQKYLAQQGKVSDLSLIVEFKGARLDPQVDALAFKFDIPSGAEVVQDFQSVPRPEPPSKLLGQKISEFAFTALDGQKVTRESLAGKIVVVDFWATWCRPCLESLPNLQRVYEQYKSNDKVAFLAVSIDQKPVTGVRAQAVSLDTSESPTASDEEVAAAFKQANLSIPIVRDLAQFANLTFGVKQIPNMFVIGADGTVQDHEIGANPEIASELPGRLDKLLAGGSIHQDALRRYESRLRDYEAQFKPAAGTTADPLPNATLAPASEPATVKLTKLWTCETLQQPGNLLVVAGEEGKSPQILVNDGWDSVVELGTDGKVVATHPLDLPKQPEQGIVTYLRSAIDSDGKRFLIGSASNRQQLHVFDRDWKRVFSYPEGTSAGGIADVQVGDLDGDGHPELNVSYFDVVGVQNVSLEGKRRWANRALANVLSLAVTGPDQSGHRRLLCTNERGTLVPINDQGDDGPPIEVGKRFLRLIAAADLDGDGQPEYCGMAATRPGEDTLVGLDLVGTERWSYPLPRGLQEHKSLEMLTSGKLVSDKAGQWVVAGADGTVTILAADGTLIDRFGYGKAISGLAVADFDGQVLLVSTAKAVEAWKVEPR
jgi:thiol-disulfide isomerase/thioredoxin/outer membrane lipoprotein-sorting protein